MVMAATLEVPTLFSSFRKILVYLSLNLVCTIPLASSESLVDKEAVRALIVLA